jgi:hypothetical protein
VAILVVGQAGGERDNVAAVQLFRSGAQLCVWS